MKFLITVLIVGAGLLTFAASPSGCLSVAHHAKSGAARGPQAPRPSPKITVIEARFEGDTLAVHASMTAKRCNGEQRTTRHGSVPQTESASLQEPCSTPIGGVPVLVALEPPSTESVVLDLGHLDAHGVGRFSVPDQENARRFLGALCLNPGDTMRVMASDGYVVIDPEPWRRVLAERDWLRVNETGAIDEYESFLRSHPGSEHEQAAKHSLASLYAESMLKSKDVEELDRFTTRFAGTPEAGRARERLASIRYAELHRSGTPRELLAFASRFSDLRLAAKAKALAERRAWARSRNSSDTGPLEEYIELFPDSRRGATLRVKLEKIRARRARERACSWRGSRCGCSKYRKYECGGACCRWYVGYGCACR